MLERFTGDARGVVTGAREGVLRLGHDWIGCEHLLLALVTHLGLAIVSMTDGAVPPILSALGSSGPRLRAEILRRYRQAS